jgi:dolichol-phosphate mannosyltransferase
MDIHNQMLSILIPAYNEADIIGQTVAELSAPLDEEEIDYEILVVDDGSCDATKGRLLELENCYPRVRHITNPGPHGYGFAVRYGLEHYLGDAAVIVMADGSDSPRDVIEYYRKVQAGYDCAFGSRFVAGVKVSGYPVLKRILNRLGNRLIGLLLARGYDDFTNGFKCYKREVIEKMRPLVSGQFNLTIEMSVKAVVQGARFAVIPTDWRDRDVGTSKFNVISQSMLYLITLLYCLSQVWLVPRVGKPAR